MTWSGTDGLQVMQNNRLVGVQTEYHIRTVTNIIKEIGKLFFGCGTTVTAFKKYGRLAVGAFNVFDKHREKLIKDNVVEESE